MASVTLRFTPRVNRTIRVGPASVPESSSESLSEPASRSVVPEVYENASSSSLELDVSDVSDGSPVSPTAPGVGADAGSHDAASVTGRQQDVQYESLKWNVATRQALLARGRLAIGRFRRRRLLSRDALATGQGGTDVEYEGAVSIP